MESVRPPARKSEKRVEEHGTGESRYTSPTRKDLYGVPGNPRDGSDLIKGGGPFRKRVEEISMYVCRPLTETEDPFSCPTSTFFRLCFTLRSMGP